MFLRHARTALAAAALVAGTTALTPAPAAQANAPIGNLPGWTQTFRDDFSGALNTSVWGRYSGRPGGNPYGWWDPSHVLTSSGSMRLRGYRVGGTFVTGGVMLNRPQTYGKWLVRARFDRAVGIEQVMLLWPTFGWPPELDFAEGASNGHTMATAHWNSTNAQAHFWANVDMRVFHTYGIEWTPTAVKFQLDGHTFGEVRGYPVPHQPMSLALQTHATQYVGAVSALQPAEVTEYVDWVSVYRYQ